MHTIWKFQLLDMGDNSVRIPKHATLLHVSDQGGVPTLWALVEPHLPIVYRVLYVAGTGHELPQIAAASTYVGTAHCAGLVLHVFDLGTVGDLEESAPLKGVAEEHALFVTDGPVPPQTASVIADLAGAMECILSLIDSDKGANRRMNRAVVSEEAESVGRRAVAKARELGIAFTTVLPF